MRLRSVLVLAGFGLGAVATTLCPEPLQAAPSAAPVLAKPAGKKPAAKVQGPTEIDKKVKLSPDGLKFGLTLKALSALYSKVFDKEFLPLYQRVQPGPRMAELDAELADKKELIRRNHLEFGSLPMGLDRTPLAGEYSYNNGESLTHVTLRDGVKRYFFFFNDRLWKIYDEHKVGKASKLGKDFDEVTEKLTKRLGKEPRRLEADPDAKRYFPSADWADKETIIRVLDRGDVVVLAYIDRKVEESLDKYRANKGDTGEALDRDVADVTKGGDVEDKNSNVGAAYKAQGKKK